MDEFECPRGLVPSAWNRHPLSCRYGVLVRMLIAAVVLVCGEPTGKSIGAGQTVRAAQDTSPRRSRRQTEVLLVDLSKKETSVVLEISAEPGDVEVTDIQVHHLPAAHHLAPRTGVVRHGEPVDIILHDPPGVRIRLMLVTRGDHLVLRVSPQIMLRNGEMIELTALRIERATRSFQRRIKGVQQRLAALATERVRLQTWLNSPQNKSLHEVKSARSQIKLLEREIQAQQQEIPLIRQQCEALQFIAQFVGALHEQTEIQYSVRVRDPQQRR